MVEKIISNDIIDGNRFDKNPKTTHVRFYGKNFIQYHCNPSPEQGMRSVSSDATGFVVREEKVEGRVNSYVVETTGGKTTETYHCMA